MNTLDWLVMGGGHHAHLLAVVADLSAVEGPGGDLIVAIDGQPITTSDDLISYLVFETVVGQTVDLTVVRDGQEISLPLTLGARP